MGVTTLLSTASKLIYAVRNTPVPGTAPPGGLGGRMTRELLWYRHLGQADGSASWDGPRKVGNGWDFAEVFVGPHGAVYAVKNDGEMLWYDHEGAADGSFRWMGPKSVGSGWAMAGVNPPGDALLGVFCDAGNEHAFVQPARRPAVVYAVRVDGTLLWYRHDGAADGSPAWANGGAPTTVGNGWAAGNQRVFSGRDGVIYLVGDDGKLRWYRHKGVLDGAFDWDGPKVVGEGWSGFATVFSLGAGIIYAVDRDGALWWYRHKGHAEGTPEWDGPNKVGSGWTGAFHVVANSVWLKPTLVN